MGENQKVIDLLTPLEDNGDLAVSYMLGMALLREKRAAEGQKLLDRILSKGEAPRRDFYSALGCSNREIIRRRFKNSRALSI